jgi:hypothetical protein
MGGRQFTRKHRRDFPDGPMVESLTANAGDTRDSGSIPESGFGE